MHLSPRRLRGTSTGCSSKRPFLLPVSLVNRTGRVSNAPMFGEATKKTECAYWQASALNLLRVSQEHGKTGDVASRLNVSVPVETERRPYGCSSPFGWLNWVGIT